MGDSGEATDGVAVERVDRATTRSRASRFLSDTDPEAERVQLELLRRAGPERRLQLALNLTHEVIALSRCALRELHPRATDEELGVLWVRHTYGDELADGLQAYLARRR